MMAALFIVLVSLSLCAYESLVSCVSTAVGSLEMLWEPSLWNKLPVSGAHAL